MDEDREKMAQETTTPAVASDVQLHEGEKGFQIILFLTGLIAFGLSLNLLGEITGHKISSAAALPLFVSGSWTILALQIIWENRKLKTPLSDSHDTNKNFKTAINYAMPMDTMVLIGCIIGYCVLLYAGLNFYIATAIFLFGGMCYLHRGYMVRNALYTVMILAFIFGVFEMLFGVVFP